MRKDVPGPSWARVCDGGYLPSHPTPFLPPNHHLPTSPGTVRGAVHTARGVTATITASGWFQALGLGGHFSDAPKAPRGRGQRTLAFPPPYSLLQATVSSSSSRRPTATATIEFNGLERHANLRPGRSKTRKDPGGAAASGVGLGRGSGGAPGGGRSTTVYPAPQGPVKLYGWLKKITSTNADKMQIGERTKVSKPERARLEGACLTRCINQTPPNGGDSAVGSSSSHSWRSRGLGPRTGEVLGGRPHTRTAPGRAGAPSHSAENGGHGLGGPGGGQAWADVCRPPPGGEGGQGARRPAQGSGLCPEPPPGSAAEAPRTAPHTHCTRARLRSADAAAMTPGLCSRRLSGEPGGGRAGEKLATFI